MNLTQKQVAEIIGVTESSIWNWEGNESSPFWRYWGPIRQFLGYDPFPPAQTNAEKLVMSRKLLGLSQKQSARQLGVDPTTLARWERGVREAAKLAGRRTQLPCPDPTDGAHSELNHPDTH